MDYVKSMLIEIYRIKKYDDKTIIETLINLLKIADNLLKYVSEFVKKALQVQIKLITSLNDIYFLILICY
jgi:hypothetical protein